MPFGRLAVDRYKSLPGVKYYLPTNQPIPVVCYLNTTALLTISLVKPPLAVVVS